MKHTPSERALHILTGISLSAGITMIAVHGHTYLQGSLSGVGSTVVEKTIETEAILRPAAYMAYAPLYEKAYAAEQFVLGILLILLGFFVHGLFRTRFERRVHITVKPREKTQRFFWMEMNVNM